LIKHTNNYKAAANWVINEIKSYANELHIHLNNFIIQPTQIAEIIKLVDDTIVSSTGAKSIFKSMLDGNKLSAIAIAEQLNLIQTSNVDELMNWVLNIIDKYPEKVQEYKKGKKGNLNLFVGELMKLSRGQADPKKTTALLIEQLEK
jgi:aspartyl-tRNA(Asn)/glutamyl-tRNA(Gln) amidotransferase subunit B